MTKTAACRGRPQRRLKGPPTDGNFSKLQLELHKVQHHQTHIHTKCSLKYCRCLFKHESLHDWYNTNININLCANFFLYNFFSFLKKNFYWIFKISLQLNYWYKKCSAWQWNTFTFRRNNSLSKLDLRKYRSNFTTSSRLRHDKITTRSFWLCLVSVFYEY